MKELRLKTKQDIEDFLAGCAFYGTGGGGDVAIGRASLNSCLDRGLDIALKDPYDMKDDETYCCAFFMGSIAPKTPETLAEIEKMGYTQRVYDPDDILIGAVRNMEEFLGRKVDGIFVAEPGGTNGACCIAAAMKMGIPILDGDHAGRAIPEATMGLPEIYKMPCLPVVYFDAWGNSSITTKTFNDLATERIGKFMSQASYGEMAEAGYVLKGSDVRKILVHRSLSKAYQVGKAMNEAPREKAAEAAAAASGGFVVAQGKLTVLETSDHDGYWWGTYQIYTGRDMYKIWFKNENHILWKNGKPYATSPNLITVIDTDTGRPVLNSHLKDGLNVSIVVSPIHDKYLTEEALEVFSPRYFGFDFDYIPFDEVRNK